MMPKDEFAEAFVEYVGFNMWFTKQVEEVA